MSLKDLLTKWNAGKIQAVAGSVVGALGAVQTYLGTADVQGLIERVAPLLHLSGPTVNGLAMILTGITLVAARKKAATTDTPK